MFSMNKHKSNMNINKHKNSAALVAKKDSIDFLHIDNSGLNFLLMWISIDSLCCFSAEVSAFCSTCILN